MTRYLHHPPEPRLLGPPHEEEDGQVPEEEHPYPVWHGVRAGAPEVPVDDDDRDQDGDGVHDECEEQVLCDERQHQGGRGQDLRYQQEEDDQREQDADAEGDLLAGLGREVEDEDAQEGNEHGGQD